MDYSGGTWNYINGVGLRITWTLASGTNFHGVADTWNSAQDFATSNQVNACDNTANDFRLAKVKFEPGQVATPFVTPDFEQELVRCQRYYEKSYNLDVDPGTITDVGIIFGYQQGTRVTTELQRKLIPKRVTPTIKWYSNVSGNIDRIRDITGNADFTISTLSYEGMQTTGIPAVTSAITVSQRTGAHFIADAEL